MPRYAGRATITWNGIKLDSKNGATIDPGGVTRNSQTTDQQSGYTEALRVSKIVCTVAIGEGTSITDLNDIKDATIQFAADTGQTYVVEGAWRVGELNANFGSDSGVELMFNGPEATEVGAA